MCAEREGRGGSGRHAGEIMEKGGYEEESKAHSDFMDDSREQKEPKQPRSSGVVLSAENKLKGRL